jgi:hypothetical protein
MANVIAPMVIGMSTAPGGATATNSAGSSAVTKMPRFCEIAMPDTRTRVGNISGKKLGKIAF